MSRYQLVVMRQTFLRSTLLMQREPQIRVRFDTVWCKLDRPTEQRFGAAGVTEL
jgi:hypothetical protein